MPAWSKYLVAVVSAICAAAFLVLAARIANSMVDLLPDAPALPASTCGPWSSGDAGIAFRLCGRVGPRDDGPDLAK